MPNLQHDWEPTCTCIALLTTLCISASQPWNTWLTQHGLACDVNNSESQSVEIQSLSRLPAGSGGACASNVRFYQICTSNYAGIQVKEEVEEICSQFFTKLWLLQCKPIAAWAQGDACQACRWMALAETPVKVQISWQFRSYCVRSKAWCQVRDSRRASMDGSPLHREILAPSIEVLSRIQVNLPEWHIISMAKACWPQ